MLAASGYHEKSSHSLGDQLASRTMRTSSAAALRGYAATKAAVAGAPRTVLAGTGAALVLTLFFGTTTLLLAVTAHENLVLLGSSLGMPLLLPGLRTTPLGQQGVASVLDADFAALLLVTIVALVLRRAARKRPDAGWLRRFLAGWRALLLGATAANAFRGLVEARLVGASVLGWLEYAAAGIVSGLIFGLLLGTLVGVATAAPRIRLRGHAEKASAVTPPEATPAEAGGRD
jgi:hypothetical protein